MADTKKQINVVGFIQRQISACQNGADQHRETSPATCRMYEGIVAEATQVRDAMADLIAMIPQFRGQIVAALDYATVTGSEVDSDECRRLLALIDSAPDRPMWCLHLRGPDDVFAAPSKEAAEAAARHVNEHFANHEVKPDAVAAPWPHSVESHAESLGDWAEQWGAPECGTCGGGGYVLDAWQTAADCPKCNQEPQA